MTEFIKTNGKTTPHISLTDWFTEQWKLEHCAETNRITAFDLRNSGRTIRSDTQIQTEWNTRINSKRLINRVTELSRWQEVFQFLLERFELEIRLLKDEKNNTEKEIEHFDIPLQITNQCILKRDSRRDTELTYDDGDTELKKELCILKKSKKILTDRVREAWEKLKSLEEMKSKINLELANKCQALEIDQQNSMLDYSSACINYRPHALDTSKESVSYENWLEHSRQMKLLADNDLSEVYSFREAIMVMRERIKNDIESQQDFTDFTLRKRIFQTQKAKNELEWGKFKMEKEIELLSKEIYRLEEALLQKENAVKCAETRLENRKGRSEFELCQDECEAGLKEEIFQLQKTKNDLTESINETKLTYENSKFLLTRIKRNLEDKEHSLMIDVMCLDMRSALKTRDRAKLANETDRNIILTRMENEIPLEI